MSFVARFAEGVASGLEGLAAVVIAVGALQALYALAKRGMRMSITFAAKREVWFQFAVWLLLGLEFALAADIVRTASAPTWTTIGQLGAIAIIRTFLNYILEKDIERANTGRKPAPTGAGVG